MRMNLAERMNCESHVGYILQLATTPSDCTGRSVPGDSGHSKDCCRQRGA
jgi:hypothetical protein